jgi:hypothetical protein
MKRNLMIFLVAAIDLFSVSAAIAHHSHLVYYDQCKKVTIEGRVESAEWKNPHILIVVRKDDGSKITAELTSLQGLGKDATPAQAAFTVGARVVVVGNPMRDSAEIRARFVEIQGIKDPYVLDVLQIRRMDGSFKWEQVSPTPPTDCKQP